MRRSGCLSAVTKMQNAMNTQDSKCPECNGRGGNDYFGSIWATCATCGGTGQTLPTSPTLPKDSQIAASGPASLAFGGAQDQKAEPLAWLDQPTRAGWWWWDDGDNEVIPVLVTEREDQHGKFLSVDWIIVVDDVPRLMGAVAERCLGWWAGPMKSPEWTPEDTAAAIASSATRGTVEPAAPKAKGPGSRIGA